VNDIGSTNGHVELAQAARVISMSSIAVVNRFGCGETLP
jgi:hypothetical protein